MSTEKSVRILLVEDNPGDAYLIEEALQAARIRFVLARYPDGEKALSALRSAGEGAARPDIILLDMRLPRGDGEEVLAELRALPGLEDVPVGLISSGVPPRNPAARLVRYYKKPLDVEEYFQTVVRAVRQLVSDSGARAAES
jgi:CheY-like chemotaxis protein